MRRPLVAHRLFLITLSVAAATVPESIPESNEEPAATGNRSGLVDAKAAK